MGLGFESQADHDDLYIRHNVRFYARYVFVSCVFLASSEIRVINSSDSIFPSKSNSMISPKKMIYKIQLIGNKQVTLFVKLNR